MMVVRARSDREREVLRKRLRFTSTKHTQMYKAARPGIPYRVKGCFHFQDIDHQDPDASTWPPLICH